MSNYFSNVKITRDFINDLNNWDPIYGFKFSGISEDVTEVDMLQWIPFEFNPVTKELKLIIGCLGVLVRSANIYYGLSNDISSINKKAFSFDVDNILGSSSTDEGNGVLYTTLTIDLSPWNISTEFKSMATDIGADGFSGLLRFDEEHFHFTGEKDNEFTDQYNSSKLLSELQSSELLLSKLNTPKSDGIYISDSDGFYEDGQQLLDFQLNGVDTDFLLKIDLEEVYHMNDYRVNLLGKEVSELSDNSRVYLNGLVLDKPDEPSSRKLTYVNLPNQFIFHNQVLESGTNLDTVFDAGVYRIEMGSNFNGAVPLDFTYFTGLLLVQPLGNKRYIQIIIGSNNQESYQFRRYIDDSIVTPWVENIDRKNLNNYITFDLIIRNEVDLGKYLNDPNKYDNVAFVGNPSLGATGYNLASLSGVTLTTSNIIGFGATVTINNLTSNGNTCIRDLNIVFNRTQSGTSTTALLHGFKSVDNITFIPTLVESASATLMSNCRYINNVYINSGAISGTLVTCNSCNFVSNVRYSDLNKPISVIDCNYVDPYTCVGIIKDSDYLGHRPSSCWYSSNVVTTWDGVSDLELGATIITSNMQNPPAAGLTYPLIVNTDIGYNYDGSKSDYGAQYLLSSNGNKWVRIYNGEFGEWKRLVVEGDDLDMYNIYVKRSLYNAPIKITRFNNTSTFITQIKVKDTVNFYSESAPDGPWNGASPVWGKICRQDIGYSCIVTDGVDIAVGRYIDGDIDIPWKYMSSGTYTYSDTSFKSKREIDTNVNRYVQLNAGLTELDGTRIRFNLPSNFTGAICISVLIAYNGNIVNGDIYGSYSGTAWSSMYSTFDSSLVTNVIFGKKLNDPCVWIEMSSNSSKLIKADLISQNEVNLDEFIVKEVGTPSGDESPIGTNNTAYKVTDYIGNKPINQLFDLSKNSATNSLGLITTENTSSELYLVGVSDANGSRAYVRTDLKVTPSGQLNARSHNATSALSEKENVVDANFNALELIDNTKIIEFNFKGDNSKKIGFGADNTDKLLAGENHDIMDMYNCHGTELKAIQELHKIIKDQDIKIKELEKLIKEN